MLRAKTRKSRRPGATAGLLALALSLSACGADNEESPQRAAQQQETENVTSAVIALREAGAQRIKESPANNLLDLSGNWSAWSGEASGVSFDESTGAVRIPASGQSELIIGVRRFDQSLTAGKRYTLTMDATNSEAAVVLVLFRAGGTPAEITSLATGATTDWAAARQGGPLSFEAPDGIVGFYLQVQSAWQTSSADRLTAQLRFADSNDAGPTSGTPLAATEGVFSLAGNWPDWSGRPTGIRYDADSASLVLPAPSAGRNQTVGVRRHQLALIAGQTYTVDTRGSSGGGALIFTLRDSSGSALSMADPGSGASMQTLWINGGQQASFIAPTEVSRIDVQAQGPWHASASTYLKARLSPVSEGSLPGPVPSADDFRPAGYNEIFLADEFDGANLDRSKWCTRLPFGGGPALQLPDAECTKFSGQGNLDYSNVDEQQRFRDFATGSDEALHQLGHGMLSIRATRTGPNNYQRFEAGALRSKKTFKPDIGNSYYIAARVRLPDILGIWPALFLLPSLEPTGDSTWPPEIDVFEAAINNTPGENETTMVQHGRIQGAQTDSGNSEWTFAADGFNIDWGFYTAPASLREQWLVIGAEWTASGVCYFIDGYRTGCENYRWVSNDGQPANAATLIMYLAVGGSWAGKNGVDDSKFPAIMEVDYIRVYKK